MRILIAIVFLAMSCSAPKIATPAPLLCDAQYGGQGCCSHHGGVCGCVGLSVQCCDYSFSPSCQCR